MIHYIALYRLGDDADETIVEWMVRSCHSLLFRIHEVHNLRSGRQVGGTGDYEFFVSIDFESLEKLKSFRDDSRAIKFTAEVVAPHTAECLELIYETEPGKDPRYS